MAVAISVGISAATLGCDGGSPEVAQQQAATYTDPVVCQECHADVWQTFRHTGIARSFCPANAGTMQAHLRTGEPFYHRASERYYAVIERAGRYFQRRPLRNDSRVRPPSAEIHRPDRRFATRRSELAVPVAIRSRQDGLAGRLLGGRRINSIGVLQAGLPLIVRGASNFQANRPDSTGTSAKLSNRTAEQWFDTGAFVNPSDFTFGNLGRALPDARSPGTVNFDLSMIKNTYVTERVNVQFNAGADGFNQSATFGTITAASDARVIQFALKVVF